MSYEIIYYKQFIKISNDKFVPMILAGSNNCTEFTNGRERRSRSWFPHTYMLNGKLYGSLTEMVKTAEEIRKQIINRKDNAEEYIDRNFGYYEGLEIKGTDTTYQAFVNLFKNGCKKAKTVEELTALYITVVVENGYISYDDKTTERKQMNVKTTEELINAIDELTEYYKGTKIGVTIRYNNSTDYVVNKLKKSSGVTWVERHNKRSEKLQLLNDAKDTFQIKLPNGGYLVKLTKYGYKYVMYEGYPGKRFLTEKDGNTYLNKLKKRRLECSLVKLNSEKL